MRAIHIVKVPAEGPELRARLPEMARMGERFTEAAGLDFDPVHWMGTWMQLLAVQAGHIWVAEAGGAIAGAIGVVVAPCPNSGKRQAMETFWWVDPAHRGTRAALLLLNALEAWAETGADVLLMVHLEALQPERLKKLYERRGFVRVETVYKRRIQ